MNTIVILITPVGATQQDVEDALREYFASMETGKIRKQVAQPEPVREDEWPMWTWFLPNPCR